MIRWSSEMTERWCWLCDSPEDCDLCRPDEPGQLGLFDANEVLIEQDLANSDRTVTLRTEAIRRR